MPVPGAVDLVLGAIVAVSVLAGLWRGLVYEVLAVAGWLVAFVVAQRHAITAAEWLPVGAPGSTLNTAAGFAAAFVLTLVVWALGSALVRRLVRASPLSGVDRVLGACFGLARAALILVVVAVVVLLTPARESPGWQTSHLGGLALVAVNGLKPLLPEALARQLPTSRPDAAAGQDQATRLARPIQSRGIPST